MTVRGVASVRDVGRWAAEVDDGDSPSGPQGMQCVARERGPAAVIDADPRPAEAIEHAEGAGAAAVA
ncbi:hypothetical protein MTP10_33630 [Nonomuraea sp. 3-1Str]|uniref:hypothetical protein n=1 Tax=Nonomuraea sp. 3-1Str TaxID=2929801 RepID=UPI002858EBFD|nr:hypothetical protein [Nonomuraea sp. 3-1Str]MDR8413662.1 hypothetical protein [Nonomuraea sp. 3-1Str]